MALTDIAIRGAKPAEKAFKLYEREGLFLLVNPEDRNFGVGATDSMEKKIDGSGRVSDVEPRKRP